VAYFFLQDILAEQDGQQDTDGGADEIKDVGIVELCVDDKVADEMRQLLDDDGGCACEETRRDAEYQHETTVAQMRRTPRVEAVDPSFDLVFDFAHGFALFSAAKIEKSNAQRKKK
jgi:hypothetical protein